VPSCFLAKAAAQRPALNLNLNRPRNVLRLLEATHRTGGAHDVQARVEQRISVPARDTVPTGASVRCR